MNKLEQITKTLESREDVIITAKEASDYNKYTDIYPEEFSEEVSKLFQKKYGIPMAMEISFLVSPKGGLYEEEQLQQFMLSLIPNIEPHHIEDFHEGRSPNNKPILHLGALFFQEEMGKLKITEEVKVSGNILEEMLKKDSKKQEEGIEIIEQNKINIGKISIHQDINIYVFPNKEIVEDFNRRNIYVFPNKEIVEDFNRRNLKSVYLNQIWRYISKKTLNHFNPNHKGLLKRLFSK